MSRTHRYTTETRQVLTYAREEAIRLRHRMVSSEHILLGLLRLNDPLIEGIFIALHTSTQRIAQAIEFVAGRGNKALLSEPVLNASARTILQRADEESGTTEAELIAPEHILLGILCDKTSMAVGVLESFGVSLDTVRTQLPIVKKGGYTQTPLAAEYQARYDATPTLNQLSRDLTIAALTGTLDPMIGRENELERTMQILSRRSKNNPVLIGPAGVGKTAIAEGLALRIVAGQVPENLRASRVVALDIGLITVGTKFRGDFEDRLKRIMQEILASPGIIIVIDELHALVGTGVAEGSIDAANLFKPMLARGEFRCIGATTVDEYRKTIEADPALERRFQPVQVGETSTQETLAILQGLRPHYAEFHHVMISDEALLAAVHLSSRYIQNRFQPDKAIDLIDEAASRLNMQRSVAPERIRTLRDHIIITQRAKEYAITKRDFATASQQRQREIQLRRELQQAEQEWHTRREQSLPTVYEQDIASIVTMWTGIPVMRIATEEAERLLTLEDELHQRVIGQEAAVYAVAKAIRRSRTDLRDTHRPIGSFLFVGPTGVGKTELARGVAATLFGDENAMTTLDMSEFMESHSVSRLVGAPLGYIGYDRPGQLTEAIHRRPYSVVLFDEIEKAHPKIFDLLLQILEDGRLTDSHGQSVDFRNTIIIITSNIGTAQRPHNTHLFFHSGNKHSQQEQQASRYQDMQNQIMLAIKEAFKPELLNRLDDIVLFHELEVEHLHQIVTIMIEHTRQRLAEQSITLHVSDTAQNVLVRHGYEREYGARPLRRTVQRMLEDSLAEAILQGQLSPGDTVFVDALDDRLTLHVSAQQGTLVPAIVKTGNAEAA